MKKKLISLSERKSWNLFLENLIEDWSMLEICIKYLLHALAIASGLVNEILFLKAAEAQNLKFFSDILAFWYLSKYFLNHYYLFENNLGNMTVYFFLVKLIKTFCIGCA